ncbi:MAG: DUF374 domain-containing protein [Candidatus Adiutrix sp.]|jgi:lysophospholipid acyltransferase (LPLAT)-like uncharacterized protein|nr:DUF374 domain-containing protein [Candidatus Adiutrix sp.]
MSGAGPTERFFLDWPTWAGRLLKLIFRGVRLRIVGEPDLAEVGPIILAHWHADDLCLLPTLPHLRADILVSQSRDGAMLGRALAVLGHQARRGSSSRGGAAGLLALKHSLESGHNVAFAADGPRGPRLVAKPGAFYLAAKTGRPLAPLGVAVDMAFTFKKSWNQTRLPLPGAQVVIAYGPLLTWPREAARWPAHQQSHLLGAAIDGAVRLAEAELARWRGR